MHKHVILGVVVVAVVGLGAWFVMSHDKASAPSAFEDGRDPGSSRTIKSNQAASVSEMFAGTGSFLDLMGLGKDLMCDFKYVADETNATVAGTVKISSKKIRGDFQMQQAGETYDSHMIQNGGYMYTWTESPMGTFALRMDVNKSIGTTTSDTEAEAAEYDRAVDLNNDVDYDCRAWTADNSVFTPPEDIEFMDPDTMMQNMMQNFDPSAFEE